MQTGYVPSPTPSRSFPAVKTPPPIEPERKCGAVKVESILDRIEADSLGNLERLLALSVKMAGCQVRWAREAGG